MKSVIIICVCMCDTCTYKCLHAIWICMCIMHRWGMWRTEEDTDIFLCLPYSFEMGSLTEPGATLAASMPR